MYTIIKQQQKNVVCKLKIFKRHRTVRKLFLGLFENNKIRMFIIKQKKYYCITNHTLF